jgi:hypothetical protein
MLVVENRGIFSQHSLISQNIFITSTKLLGRIENIENSWTFILPKNIIYILLLGEFGVFTRK